MTVSTCTRRALLTRTSPSVCCRVRSPSNAGSSRYLEERKREGGREMETQGERKREMETRGERKRETQGKRKREAQGVRKREMETQGERERHRERGERITGRERERWRGRDGEGVRERG